MCIKKNKSQSYIDDGKKALIIANAAYKSLESGKVVNIKF